MPQIIQPLPIASIGIQITTSSGNNPDMTNASRLWVSHNHIAEAHEILIDDANNNPKASFSLGGACAAIIEKDVGDKIRIAANHAIFATPIGYRDDGYHGEVINELDSEIDLHNYSQSGANDANTMFGHRLVKFRNTYTQGLNAYITSAIGTPGGPPEYWITRFMVPPGITYFMKRADQYFQVQAAFIKGTPVAF